VLKARKPSPQAAVTPAPQDQESRAVRQLKEAEAQVASDPQDPAGYHRVAIAAMRLQREGGKVEYYHQAERALRKAASLAPGDYQTQKLLAWVLAGTHQFDAALKIARDCARRQPGDYWNYGVIGDALTETGHYEEAVAAVQTMVDLRPGSTTYARAAHQRRLHGQSKGALELFELALDATGPAEHEAFAWLHTQMAEVAFEAGDLTATQEHLTTALRFVPGYHLAAADQARLLAARGDLAGAAAAYEQVLRRVERPDWTAALGDVYLAQGRKAEAEQHYAAAERYLAARLDDPTADAGHALATLLADRGRQPRRALELASEEVKAAKDIRAWDTYAWALYHTGRYDEAWTASRQALRIGTLDPKLLYHAGAIGTRLTERRREGIALLRRAIELNPAWHPLDAPAARELLRSMGGMESAGGTRRLTHAVQAHLSSR
jgi:tetratricopeptide (TPR) repeat protein